jgi:hypothetical protein
MNAISPPPDATPALGRILSALRRSLPMYLEDARPWSAGGDEAARAALGRLAADEKTYARRLAEAILRRGGQPPPVSFPLEYTSLNDVSLDYLLQRVLAGLDVDLAAVARAADDLVSDSEAAALAGEVLGNLQGHREILHGINVPSPSGSG